MTELDNRPGGLYWTVAVVALVWNLIGVATYLGSVMGETATAPAMPAWVTGAYAIAVFGGTFGAVGLLLRKAWAVPLFALSLVAVIAQWGYILIAMDMEPAGLVLPVLILLIAAYLLWAAISAKNKGWLA